MDGDFEFAGHWFSADAIERAELREDPDGAQWWVPMRDGGEWPTTDEGLRQMREARMDA